MRATAPDHTPGDAGPEAVRVRHGDDDGPAPSVAVIEAIAELSDADPTDLSTEGVVLYDHVDPDALDALVADHDGDLDVSLSVAGYDVSVDSEAAVVRHTHT